jgi:hypothetical protein
MPDNNSTKSPTSTQLNAAAKKIDPATRQEIAVSALAKKETVTDLSRQHSTSRKFIYKQKETASTALDDAFSEYEKDSEVLFYIPVTKAWLEQVVLALILICHSSYGGVVEFFRDILGRNICKGTVFNIVRKALLGATEINKAQDLSGIEVGAHDEIFQRDKPVLVGCDVKSTYTYLLSLEEHRDTDTWGTRLLELSDQGMKLDHTIADGGKGLRSGQKEAWPDVPCWGDVFHPLYDIGKLCSFLEKRAAATTESVEKLERKITKAKKKSEGSKYSRRLGCARKEMQTAVDLHCDVSTLAKWLEKDILSVAGPSPEVRKELLQFIVDELIEREAKAPHRIRPVRRLLENQGEELLSFAKLLEVDLQGLSYAYDVDVFWIREVLALQAISSYDNLYWEHTDQLWKRLGDCFYDIQEAVRDLVALTVRASSIVENINSRLRNYFFLRKTLGQGYLELLQFFFNHRRFLRSSRSERVGSSPKELLTGQEHAHWLELLGYTLFRQAEQGTPKASAMSKVA